MNSNSVSNLNSIDQDFNDLDIPNNFTSKQKTKSAQFYFNNTETIFANKNHDNYFATEADNTNSFYSTQSVQKLITPQHARSHTLCNQTTNDTQQQHQALAAKRNKDFKIYGKKKKSSLNKAQENKNPNININCPAEELNSDHKQSSTFLKQSKTPVNCNNIPGFFNNNNMSNINFNSSLISSISGNKNQIITVEDSQELLIPSSTYQGQQQPTLQLASQKQQPQHQQLVQQQQQHCSGSIPNTFKTEPNTLSKVELNIENSNFADYNITSFNEKSPTEDYLFGDNASFTKTPIEKQQQQLFQHNQQQHDVSDNISQSQMQTQLLQQQNNMLSQLQHKPSSNLVIDQQSFNKQQNQDNSHAAKYNANLVINNQNNQRGNQIQNRSQMDEMSEQNQKTNLKTRQLLLQEEEELYSEKLSNMNLTPVPLEQMRLTNQKRLANCSVNNNQQIQQNQQQLTNTSQQQQNSQQSSIELQELSQNNIVFKKFIEIINKRFEQLEKKLDNNCSSQNQQISCICGHINNSNNSSLQNSTNNQHLLQTQPPTHFNVGCSNHNNNNYNTNFNSNNKNNIDGESILTASISVTGKKTIINEDLKRSSQQNIDQFSQTYLPSENQGAASRIQNLELRIKAIEDCIVSYQGDLEKRLRDYKQNVEMCMNKFVDMSQVLNDKLDHFSREQLKPSQVQNTKIDKIVHEEEYNILSRRITHFNEELSGKIVQINEQVDSIKKILNEQGKLINEDKQVLKNYEDDFCKLLNLYKECNEHIEQGKWLSDEITFLKQRQIQTLNLIKRLSEQISQDNSIYDIQDI